MPRSFFEKNCLDYHKMLQTLAVERIGDGTQSIGNGVATHHLPGHSPDSLAVLLNEEALVVGDIVLPDISPWPTRLEQYNETADILKPLYPAPGSIFGLERYLHSLKALLILAQKHPGLQVFPAHRVYYRERWHIIDLKQRIGELIAHHIQRCAAILEIVGDDEMDSDTIARRHFDEALLKGPGKLMAANEIISHCELLASCGDLCETGEHRYTATGSSNFEHHILP